MMDEGDDDAVSIVSNTTKNSEETIPNIPVMNLQDTVKGQINKYEDSVLDTTPFQTYLGGLSSPIIPFHDASQYQPASGQSQKSIDDNIDTAAGGDDCSQVSEILIPLKTTVRNNSKVKTDDRSVTYSQMERQDLSQSLLPKCTDQAAEKVMKDGETKHDRTTETPTKNSKTQLQTTGKNDLNPSVYRTRSNSKPPARIFNKQNSCCSDSKKNSAAVSSIKHMRSAEMDEHHLTGSLSQLSQSNRLNTKDDEATEKLNLRIGKLLNTIDKVPSRQQEVIKTTVEHCMMNLQDNLEKRLSNIQGELDALSFSKLRRLIVLIQANLTRVMTFYKNTETQRSPSSLDQPSFTRMHQQHKKNLLAIVQRQKSLVNKFKCSDRRKLPKSVYESQSQVVPVIPDDIGVRGSQKAKIQTSQDKVKGEVTELEKRTCKRQFKRVTEHDNVQINKRKKTDQRNRPSTDSMVPTSDDSEVGASYYKTKTDIDISGVNKYDKDMKCPKPGPYNSEKVYGADNTMVRTKPDVERPIATVGVQVLKTCTESNNKTIGDKPDTIAETMWLSMLYKNTKGAVEDIPSVYDREAGDADMAEHLVGKTVTGDIDNDSNEQVEGFRVTNITQSESNNATRLVVDDTISSQSCDHLGSIQSDNDEYGDDYFSDNDSMDILTASKVANAISGLNEYIPDEKTYLHKAPFMEYVANGLGLENKKVTSSVDNKHSLHEYETNRLIQKEHFAEPKNTINIKAQAGVESNLDLPTQSHVELSNLDLPTQGQVSPTSTCVSSDIFMVKTQELDRRQKQRLMEENFMSGKEIHKCGVQTTDGEKSADRKEMGSTMETRFQLGSDNRGKDWSMKDRIGLANDFDSKDVHRSKENNALKSNQLVAKSNLYATHEAKQTGDSENKASSQFLISSLHKKEVVFTKPADGSMDRALPQRLGVKTHYKDTQSSIGGQNSDILLTQSDVVNIPSQNCEPERYEKNKQIKILPKPFTKPTDTKCHHVLLEVNSTLHEQGGVEDSKDGKQKPINLPSWRELMGECAIKPGQNVLSVIIKHTTHLASITVDGKVSNSRGIVFNTPAKWMSSLLSGQTVNKLKAFKQIMYIGKPILTYCSSDTDMVKVENKKPMVDNTTAKKDQNTQTDGTTQATLNRTGVTDTHLNTLLSHSIIHVLQEKDFVSCADLPDNFWTEDYSQVRLSKRVWDSVTLW